MSWCIGGYFGNVLIFSVVALSSREEEQLHSCLVLGGEEVQIHSGVVLAGDYDYNVCTFSIYHSILSYHDFLTAKLTLEPCSNLSLPSLLLEALPSRIPLALHHEEVQEDDAVRTELGPPHRYLDSSKLRSPHRTSFVHFSSIE